jgi:hypothetical protein
MTVMTYAAMLEMLMILLQVRTLIATGMHDWR